MNATPKKTARKKTATPPAPARRASAAAAPKGADVRDLCVAALDAIAAGNLNVAFDFSRSGDDPIYPAIARMQEAFRARVGEVGIAAVLAEKATSSMRGSARAVRETSTRVDTVIGESLGAIEMLRENMNSVSASTEQLNANMQAISGAAQHSNEHIGSVRTSIQELTRASRDIAENAVKATEVSKAAMKEVSAALALVNELTGAAKEIDVVTSTISEISDQTKLLALNATIEAARAGEMGKGFAVVAKEVKDLASQTNSATKDIQRKIGIIHEVTRRTVDAIATINDVMKRVNESITSIAAAAEEQSVSTNDIGENVTAATDRIQEMTSSVSGGAVAVRDVAKSIVEATNLAEEASRGVTTTTEAGREIGVEAATLYAQALEVMSHMGEMGRWLNSLELSAAERAASAEAPSVLCRFTRNFDVQVGRFNDEHQRIFDSINDLHAGIKNKASTVKLRGIVRRIADVARAHFQAEEEAMQRTSFPGLQAQKIAHGRLLDQLDEFMAAFEANRSLDYISILEFCREWLIDHILEMDKEYGDHFEAHGVF